MWEDGSSPTSTVARHGRRPCIWVNWAVSRVTVSKSAAATFRPSMIRAVIVGPLDRSRGTPRRSMSALLTLPGGCPPAPVVRSKRNCATHRWLPPPSVDSPRTSSADRDRSSAAPRIPDLSRCAPGRRAAAVIAARDMPSLIALRIKSFRMAVSRRDPSGRGVLFEDRRTEHCSQQRVT